MELSFLVILLCCLIAGVSLWLFTRSKSQEHTDSQSGKQISWFSLAGSFVAYQIGGSWFLYLVDCAQSDGIYAIFYPLGSALGLLALGLGLGARISRLQISSVPDLFEKHYRSHTLRKISCFLTMATILGLLVAQAVALKDLFKALGVKHDTLFIGAWIAVVYITIRGRSKTKAWIAMLQAVLLLGALGVACFLSPDSPTSNVTCFNSFSGIETEMREGFNSKLAAYLLIPCLFVFLEPEMVKSAMQVRSKKEISVAVIVSGIILLICSFIPVYYGIAGKMAGSEESSASGFISAVGTATNPIITVISACILMVALVSAASALLWSLNTHLLRDFSGDTETKKKSIFKFNLPFPVWGGTITLGMLALVFSYVNLGIAWLILGSYELAVVCMFVPLVQAAFARSDQEYPKLAAGLSMCFGAIGFCLTKYYDISFFPEAFSMLLSWLGFMVGKMLSSKKYAKEQPHADSKGLKFIQ